MVSPARVPIRRPHRTCRLTVLERHMRTALDPTTAGVARSRATDREPIRTHTGGRAVARRMIKSAAVGVGMVQAPGMGQDRAMAMRRGKDQDQYQDQAQGQDLARGIKGPVSREQGFNPGAGIRVGGTGAEVDDVCL